MKKYNEEAIRSIEFRKNELEKNLDMIRDSISGISESFRVRVTDGNDVIVPAKLEDMAEKMLEGYERYRNDIEMKEHLTDDMRKLYMLFLYCAATAPSVNSILTDPSTVYDHYVIADTYKDIIELARGISDYDIQKRVEWELALFHLIPYEDENGWPALASCEFFDLMDLGVETILAFDKEKGYSHEDVPAKFYNDDEMKVYKNILEMYASDDNSSEKLNTQKNSPDEGAEIEPSSTDYEDEAGKNTESLKVEIYETDMPGDSEDSLTINEKVEMSPEFEAVCNPVALQEYYREREEEQSEESALAKEEWKQQLGSPDTFIEKYKEFRKLYYKATLTDFADNIETMINIYLYENEISPISFDSGYGLVDAQIRNAATKIRYEIRRKRALS